MVHDKVWLPEPLPFFRWPGMETVEVGRFQVCCGVSWDKDSPAAEGLSLPAALSGGSYSLEAMETIMSTTWFL